MTQKHQQLSLNDKHSCCSTHLKPLLQRINTLQHKLLIQTQRRENQYNQLLHILLTIKNKQKNTLSNTKIQLQQEKPISRLNFTRESINKRVKEASHGKQINSAIKDQSKAQTITKSMKKIAKPIRRSSENIKKKDTIASPHLQETNLNHNVSITQTLHKHQQEINKTKQLNNCLMEQLLMLFEQVKQLQNQQHNTASAPKSFPTQETVTSIVFQGKKEAQGRGGISSGSSDNISLKVQKMQSMMLQNYKQLRESKAKIHEHQTLFSDLISLTRGLLGNKIVQVPLFLNSNSEISPSKH